jgi:hypothetical protein
MIVIPILIVVFVLVLVVSACMQSSKDSQAEEKRR